MVDEKAAQAAGDDDDSWMDDYVSGALPRYKDHLNLDTDVDSFEKELQSIPIFMNKEPTPEEVETNPGLSALQSIVYDEGDPDDVASYYKDQGNKEYGKGTRLAHKKAIEHYTAGIAVKDCPVPLLATLYNNRAAANLALGNYRSAVADCTASRKLDPANPKLYYRGAKALCAVGKLDEALTWCDAGLQLAGSNDTLRKLRAEVKAKKSAAEKQRRQKAIAEKKQQDQIDAVMAAIKSRHISLKAHPDQLETAEDSGKTVNLLHNPSGYTVTLDQDGQLTWPVFLIYPEYGQTDMVAAFAETVPIDAMMKEVLGTPPAWDVDGLYRPDIVDIFYEYETERDGAAWLSQVNAEKTLGQVLKEDGCAVKGGLVTLLVLSHDTPFAAQYRSQFKGVRQPCS